MLTKSLHQAQYDDTRSISIMFEYSPFFIFYIMSKYKKEDRVKVIEKDYRFYNFNAIIKKVDDLDKNLPYCCHILNSENNVIAHSWFSKENLMLLKNHEKYFTISIRKHKRINLKFAL